MAGEEETILVKDIAVPIWQNKTVNFSFFMFGTFFARCFASLLKDDR